MANPSITCGLSAQDIVGIVGAVTTGASIIYGLWQHKKNSDLKRYIKAEAMEVYADVGLLLWSAQSCLEALKSGNTDLLGQSANGTERMAQALFIRAVKDIYHNYNYTREDIEKWINHKKIKEVLPERVWVTTTYSG